MRSFALRSSLICASALALVACKTPPRHEESPRPLPSTEAAVPGKPSREQLTQSLCGAREQCEVLSIKDAGTDGPLSLLVVELTTDPARAKDAGPSIDNCVPFEHWLVKARGAAITERRELLRVCNDGYGAAGIGEDSIKVEPNRFTHTRVGGSAWRWEQLSVLDLSPLRLRRTGWWNGSTVSAVAERGHFDWVDFRGRVRWYKPECPPGGGPPPPTDGDMGIVDGETDARAQVYDPIPVVQIAEAYRSGGFRTVPLGSCAPRIDGASSGFITHGAPGDSKDAAMRVVAATAGKSEVELYVEVVDDTFVGPTAKWLYDDHLELWLKDEDPDPSELCLPGSGGGGAGRLRQWAIGLDGALHAAHHATTDPIKVEHVAAKDIDGKRAVRFKIVIAAPIDALTVVYSDSDDGKTQERLLATSKLKFANVATVGHLRPIAKEEAVCEVAGGALARKLTHGFPADRPAIE